MLSSPHVEAAASLRDWLRFFAAEAHVLRLRPAQFFQQAANSSRESIAAQALGRWSSGAERRPWLRRIGKHATEPPVTLAGHTDSLIACAFSPDGLRVFSAGWDRTLRTWDATTGTELTNIPTVGVRAFSPDCKHFISSTGSDTRRLKLLDVESGGELASLGFWADPTYYRPVAFSSDSRLICWGYGLRIYLWNVETLSEYKVLSVDRTSASEPTSCAFSRDGRRIAVTFADGAIRVWDVESGTGITSFNVRPPPSDADPYGGSAPVACTFLADGRRIVVAGGAGRSTLEIWDIENEKKLAVLEGHTRKSSAAPSHPKLAGSFPSHQITH